MKLIPRKVRQSTALVCAGLITAAAASAENIKLTVWSDPVRLPIYEAFDNARDKIDLDIVTVAHKDTVTKLQLALQAGTSIPDVVWMADVNYAAQISTRRVNYLMDLSDKVRAETVAEFYPTSNAPCEKGNKLICLRNDVAHYVLWYNKPLMDKLGFDVPKTWEEYEKVGTAAAANDSGIVSGAILANVPLLSTFLANNCNLAVPKADDPETLLINMMEPQCVEAAQMVDRMIASGALALQAPFEAGFVDNAKAGKLLMIPGPTWFGEHIIKRRYEFAPGTTGVAHPPKWSHQEEPVAWSWGGGVWGGWKDTAHPDAVVDLLTFVTTDTDVAKAAVTMPAHQPASIPWGKVVNASGYYADADMFSILLESASFGHPGYTSLRIDSRGLITKAVVNDIANGASLESLLPKIQEEFSNASKLAGYKVALE